MGWLGGVCRGGHGAEESIMLVGVSRNLFLMTHRVAIAAGERCRQTPGMACKRLQIPIPSVGASAET